MGLAFRKNPGPARGCRRTLRKYHATSGVLVQAMNGEDPISQLFFPAPKPPTPPRPPRVGRQAHGFIDDKDKVIRKSMSIIQKEPTGA
jgi:hypothetical protein